MSTKHLILSITIILASMPLYAQNKDWAGFGKYSDANSNVTVKPKAVLFGDSITEGWVRQDPDFFAENNPHRPRNQRPDNFTDSGENEAGCSEPSSEICRYPVRNQ